MNYKFWKRIHEYALKKMRNKWNSQDLRCPHCNTWVSEVGKFEYKRDSKTGIDMMTCYQCGKDSYWRNEGIVSWTVEKPKSEDTI